MYEMGLSGIPMSNCNNNCSTGSTALFHTRGLIAGGLARCAIALGFEKMQVSHLTSHCFIEKGGKSHPKPKSPPPQRKSGIIFAKKNKGKFFL